MPEADAPDGVAASRGAAAPAARVGFRLGPWFLATPVESLLEVRHLAPMARVPAVEPWLLGVSNVHGHLVPVIDLGRYLLGRATGTTPACRLLVAARGAARCGLVVDEVYGLSGQAPAGAAREPPATPPARLAECLGERLDADGETWFTFDVQALLAQGGLASAAAVIPS